MTRSTLPWLAAVAFLLSATGAEASVIITIADPPPPAPLVTAEGEWSLVEDPPHSGMGASPLVTPNGPGAGLFAIGDVPSGTDIGYASSGFSFDPSSSFEVAIDFDFSSRDSTGGGAIGFGVGEDVAGADSAGVTLGFLNGAAALFATGGRVDDTEQALATLPVAAFGTGRFFVEYDSLTGDILLGVNATPGASDPAVFNTLPGFQNQWDDEPLIVSFFLRSQAVSVFSGLSAGEVTAIFTNFEVLNGSPIPEPATLMASLGAIGFLAVQRRS